MTAEFVRERITKLRLQKGVSEYKMSYDLGHSCGYINNISSGKVLPSLTEFFLQFANTSALHLLIFLTVSLKTPSSQKKLWQTLKSFQKRICNLFILTLKGYYKNNYINIIKIPHRFISVGLLFNIKLYFSIF